MKKLYTLLAAALMAGATATYAQEPAATFDFAENTWELPVAKANAIKDGEDHSYTNGTYTIVLNSASGDGYYWNADGYLMLGKKDAYLQLPAFDFAVSRIEVVGRTGASGSTGMNIYVGENAVSEATTGIQATNSYDIAADYQAAGNIYKITVTTAHNAQITAVKVYKYSSKAPANLAWSETDVNYEVGTNWVSPTFTKATTAAVTFESDNAAVAYAGEDGTIYLGGDQGTAVITATAPENDDYQAGSATITINVYAFLTYTKATEYVSGKNYLLVVQRDGNTYYANPVKPSYTHGYLSVGTADGLVDELQVSSLDDCSFLITDHEDGVTIQDYLGRYYTQEGEYKSFQVSDEEPTTDWTIAKRDDGTFSISMNDYTIMWGQGTYTTFGIYPAADIEETMCYPYLYVLKEGESGIESVGADTESNAPAAYYNLQGQRVVNPAAGIYVRVQGNKATKVLVK